MPIEGREYTTDRKGKITCLVCKSKPRFGNMKQLKMHRRSKDHMRVYKEWKATTRTKMLFAGANEPDLLGIQTRKRRPVPAALAAMGEGPSKKQKVDPSVLLSKQKQFIHLLKVMKKKDLVAITRKIAEVAPRGVRLKANGKKALAVKNITSLAHLETLMSYCEGFRALDVSKMSYELRHLREWQLMAELEQPEEPQDQKEEKRMETPSPEYGQYACWRRVVVSGSSTLHDLTKVIAKSFGWLAEDSGKAHGRFDWHKNTGKAVGMFHSDDPALQSQLLSKMKLQGHQILDVFLKRGCFLTWKFGDHKVKVSLEGVSPGGDPLKRELPRLIGGQGAAPAYIHTLRHHWTSSWGIEELFRINVEMLCERHFTDGFKVVEEWEKCRSTALRRCGPIVDKEGEVLQPWSQKEYLYEPFTMADRSITWHWRFTVETKCNVYEKAGQGSIISCLPEGTEITCDKFSVGWLHMIKPFEGWCTIRNAKEIRQLMPIMGRNTVLPPGAEE